MAEQVVGRNTDPVGERPVRKAQLELAVEIQDRQPDAVGDQAQPVLALAGFELELAQVIDVGVGHQESAHQAFFGAIGVVIDADPDRRTARGGQLALETGAFARQRGLDVGLVELEDVAADELDHLAPDHLVRALAQPLQERLVGKTVALVAIDVGQRRGERIELALRQR